MAIDHVYNNPGRIYYFAVINILYLLFIVSSCGSEIRASPPSHVSSRTLDSFGNFVQLSHAKEAATRYGRPVLVAVVDNFSSSSSYAIVISMGNSPLLRKIQLPMAEEKDAPPLPFVACCFTGVKSDANWILRQIRQHFSEVWERYGMGTHLSTPTIAYVVARLLGRFAAQSEKNEWQSVLGLPGKNDSDDNRARFSSWSRPLGIQTMILSLSSLSSLSSSRAKTVTREQNREPSLLIIEPSGRICNPPTKRKNDLISGVCTSYMVSLAAMGKWSDKIQPQMNRLLASSWEEFPPTLETCRDTLIQLLLREVDSCPSGSNNNKQDQGIDNIMVEIISSDRGRIEQHLYKYDENYNTFAEVSPSGS